ncbi:MAG: CcmD family protein [Chitinophagaceae bacterium]
MRLRSIFLAIFLLFIQVQTWAQTAAPVSPEMASELRQSGKIYVVVLVMATIFTGIILFLIFLDRKVRKLEQKQ